VILSRKANEKMAEYKREDVAKVFQTVKKGKISPIYLICGDRFLCGKTADALVRSLIPDSRQRKQNLRLIDGDKESPLQTLNILKTYSLFPGHQVVKVADSKLLQKKEAATEVNAADNQPPGGLAVDVAEKYIETFTAGVPTNNVLILLSEEVDRRKRLYTFIKKNGVVLDLSVAAGNSQAARKEQETVLRELVEQTMAEFGKKIEPRALPVFFERVGFHPVAVVREAEKLALYAEEPAVSLKDVDEMVGRTREDALFELTEAYSDKKMTQVLVILSRMLDSGVHPLVVVSGLRNHFKKLLLVCSFRKQADPVFVDGMTFASFQKGYLVELKEKKPEQLKMLPNHPYALFMMFDKAKRCSVLQIMHGLKKLLEAEFRLKSSQLSGKLVLENFVFETLAH
jgi:DNA polymerase-3 subunit delta